MITNSSGIHAECTYFVPHIMECTSHYYLNLFLYKSERSHRETLIRHLGLSRSEADYYSVRTNQARKWRPLPRLYAPNWALQFYGWKFPNGTKKVSRISPYALPRMGRQHPGERAYHAQKTIALYLRDRCARWDFFASYMLLNDQRK